MPNQVTENKVLNTILRIGMILGLSILGALGLRMVYFLGYSLGDFWRGIYEIVHYFACNIP